MNAAVYSEWLRGELKSPPPLFFLLEAVEGLISAGDAGKIQILLLGEFYLEWTQSKLLLYLYFLMSELSGIYYLESPLGLLCAYVW